MKAIVLALLATTSGCFSSWAITQASGNPRILDEDVRSQHVPLPDVRERLAVEMPLAPRYAPPPYDPTPTRAGATVTTAARPAYVDGEPLPFAFRCRSTQTASDTVYRSGYRYGTRWKTVAAAMFLIEAATATAIYFASDDLGRPGDQLAIGLIGLDALGTAALFFVPRKEIYRTEVEPVVSTLRADCPAGLALHVGDETFAVDAAGRIGELGDAALDGWMQAPTTAVPYLTYRDRVIDLAIDRSAVCTWNRHRGHDQSACPTTWFSPPAIANSIEVPMGTLTQLE